MALWRKRQMEIIKLNINEVIPYPDNPRKNDNAVDAVAESIKQCGYCSPIVIDEDNVILAGHTRLKALKKLKWKEVECVRKTGLTEEQKKKYRVLDNKTNELAEWDFDLLEVEIDGLDFDGFDFGFDDINGDEPKYGEALDEERETLRDKHIIPPFSILDTRQGYWQERKNSWKRIIRSDEGRDECLLGQGLQKLAQKQSNATTLNGTSIFDPVLCEVLIRWFCPKGGSVIDPFAGGSVRGLISVLLGNEYTGVDLSARQIMANIKNYEAIADRLDLNGEKIRKPNWINDDSMNIDKIVSGKYDFMLTCPPYADLEVYSDDPRDISNMSYEDFKAAYFEIIRKTVEKLKDNAFVAIVVGDVRDKKGYYHNFVSDTIQACMAAGLKYYNECILVNQPVTAVLIADRQFSASRKVAKIHQNVLIFVKGNEKNINLEKYEYEIE